MTEVVSPQNNNPLVLRDTVIVSVILLIYIAVKWK